MIAIFVGRLTLIMTIMMFLQEAISRPTWEGSGTHLWVATHSLRSPELYHYESQPTLWCPKS